MYSNVYNFIKVWYLLLIDSNTISNADPFIYTMVPFREMNVYDYLEYFPSRKCIISLKSVQDALRHQNIIPNFKMELFSVKYSLENVWKVFFFFENYELLEEDAIFSLKTMELYPKTPNVILLRMQHSF